METGTGSVVISTGPLDASAPAAHESAATDAAAAVEVAVPGALITDSSASAGVLVGPVLACDQSGILNWGGGGGNADGVLEKLLYRVDEDRGGGGR